MTEIANFDKNALLAKAKEQMIQKETTKALNRAIETYDRLSPMVTYYLDGHTVKEVCEKFKFQRTGFYHVLARFDVPRMRVSMAKLLASQMSSMNKQSNLTRIELMRKCGCFTCLWVVARYDKLRAGEIGY